MMKKPSWSCDEKADLLIKIGELLERGYTITECIQLFLKYEKDKLKPQLLMIIEKLNEGYSFSNSLSVLQIPKSIISFVYFAEHYGNLANGLIEGGKTLRKIEKNKQKLQKLLRYPLFLVWSLMAFMFILQQYLFPQFTLLFSSTDIPLPFITKQLLIFIESIPYYIVIIALICVFIYFYFLFFFRKKDEVVKAQFIIKLPIIGKFYQLLITYYFTINLSCLIRSGMSIFESLSIFHLQENETYAGKIANELIVNLKNGEQFHLSLLKHTIFLNELAAVVEHGQANGRLDEELEHYSKWLLINIENKIKKIFMIVQPIMFIFIGVVVLLMFTSIMLPIFSLIETI